MQYRLQLWATIKKPLPSLHAPPAWLITCELFQCFKCHSWAALGRVGGVPPFPWQWATMSCFFFFILIKKSGLIWRKVCKGAMNSLAEKTSHNLTALSFPLLLCLLITNMADTREFQSWLPWSRLSPQLHPNPPVPTRQQPIMRLVLNSRFEDSWSVTSAAFNRTLISSQISNHYWSSPTLVAPPGKPLFWRFKTAFTTTSDKRALASCTKLCTTVFVTCSHAHISLEQSDIEAVWGSFIVFFFCRKGLWKKSRWLD